MRTVSSIWLLLFPVFLGAATHAQVEEARIKPKKSKVLIKLKSGKKIKGFLYDSDNDYIYYIESRKEAKKVTGDHYDQCQKVAITDVESVRFLKSKLALLILVPLVIVGLLFIAWVRAIFGESSDPLVNISLFLAIGYAAFIFVPIGNKTHPSETFIIELKSKSLKGQYMSG